MTDPGSTIWGKSACGYARSEVSAPIGEGDSAWELASANVLEWQVKTRSGFSVDATGPVMPGQRVIVTARVLGLRILEPVQVQEVILADARVGFSYRTLPGHPVSGEEAFIVHREGDTSYLTIRSLTAPAPNLPWRLLYPLLKIAQLVVRKRYLKALRHP